MVDEKSNLVTVDWLCLHMDQPTLKILYTQMDDPVSGKKDSIPSVYIPGSLLFDFENVFSDLQSPLPHTMPSVELFEEEARKLGIDQGDTLVVYDNKGVYCSPRVWWMCKAMGLRKVKVLNGGMPAWLKQGLKTTAHIERPTNTGNFKAYANSGAFIGVEEIVRNKLNIDVVDARSAGRFKGSAPEPRAGLRSGHIPDAKNLPFTQCIEGYYLKSREEITKEFATLPLATDKQIVFSCGSGVTACILAMAASEIGYDDVSVYDGSWSEWGARVDLPIEC